MHLYPNLDYLFQNLKVLFTAHLGKEEIDQAIKEMIEVGDLDLVAIRKELEQALQNASFNWLKFVSKYEMIWHQNSDNDVGDILQMFYFYFGHFLYPERTKTKEEIQQMVRIAVDLLKEYKRPRKGKAWMSERVLQEQLTHLEAYQDWDIYYIYYVPLYDRKVEIRFELGKRPEQRTVYLRYAYPILD